MRPTGSLLTQRSSVRVEGTRAPVGHVGPAMRGSRDGRGRVRRAVLALVVALVLAACSSGDGDGDGGGGASRSPEPQRRRPEIPTEGDTVVLQFTTGGGIAGPCCDRWVVPEMTVYGDGRVVIADGGAGPVPAVRQATVDPADLADLFADAAEADLLDEPAPPTGTLCCDLSETVVVLTDATATHDLSVVGLGAEDNANADLTDDERAAREAIVDLRRQLEGLAEAGDARGPYVAHELAVYVFAGEVGPDVEPPPPWPLDYSLDQGGTPIDPDGRCFTLTTGSDTVLAAAAAREAGGEVADATTLWTSAGRTWHVLLRPLLPHEHGCP
jgi:hypothetical protein